MLIPRRRIQIVLYGLEYLMRALVITEKRDMYGDDRDERAECTIDSLEGDVAAGTNNLTSRTNDQSQYTCSFS